MVKIDGPFPFRGAVRTGWLFGIAVDDRPLHVRDLAMVSGQNKTLPDGLADAAFTDEQCKGVIEAEVAVGRDESPRDRLLTHIGRKASR